MLEVRIIDLWPSAKLLRAALPALGARLQLVRWPTSSVSHGHKCAFASERVIQQDATPERTVSGVHPAESEPSTIETAPRLLPSGLQASKLCRLTGLCSRTNVNIVNTNMRCPTCLVDHLGGKSAVTFFPAVPIEETAQLLHNWASPHSETANDLSSADSWVNAAARTFLLPTTCKAVPYGAGHATRSRLHWLAPREAVVPGLQPFVPLSLNRLGGFRPTPSSLRGISTTATLGAGARDTPGGVTAARGSDSTLNSHPSATDDATAWGGNTPTAPNHQPDVGTAAAVISSQSPAVRLRAWYDRSQGRATGISRKFMFRTINKRVIRQMARRATIGFPIIGFFFVARLLFKDYARLRAEATAGRTAIAGLFTTALACDAVDLVSQGLIIAGLAHANFGLGPGVVAEILAVADRGTVAMAVVSFGAGVTGELLTVLREAREAEARAAAVKADPTIAIEGTAAMGKDGDEPAGK